MLMKWFGLLMFPFSVWSEEGLEVNHYVDFLQNVKKKAKTYEPPKNAEEYHVQKQPQSFGAFDFVIIGAGSGGSVMANRLSEEENFSVLVLEAGGFPDNVSSIPGLLYPILFTRFNWGFHTVSQTTACLGMVDRKCSAPRGRGIGGSTLINYMAYSRGFSRDFDHWAEFVDNQIWSYKNILPYFRKAENFTYNDPDAVVEPQYHGRGGNLHVEYPYPLGDQVPYWFEANKELGYQVVDYNANQIGTSFFQTNTLNGMRYDDGTAFIIPVLHRKNLVVMTQSYVTKIGINPKTKVVESIYFSCNNTEYVVDVKIEAILSAGAFQSAQLLMLSGVGPKEHLQQHNIPVIQSLEVGSNLRDHVFCVLNFLTNLKQPHQTDEELVRDLLKGKGTLSAGGNIMALGLYPSNYSRDKNDPDIELVVIPANQNGGGFVQKAFGFTDETFKAIFGPSDVQQNTLLIMLELLHSRSTGTVRLKSNNPYEYPLIDNQYLSDSENHDINVLYEAVQLILKLTNIKAFQNINATLLSGPFSQCEQYPYLSKEYWYCAIRIITLDIYHPISTCPMARNAKQGVVDSHGLVFGIKNLRVVDASVIPFTVSAHPNAVIVMLADVISDLIKSKYGS